MAPNKTVITLPFLPPASAFNDEAELRRLRRECADAQAELRRTQDALMHWQNEAKRWAKRVSLLEAKLDQLRAILR